MRKKLFSRILSVTLSVTMAFGPSITAFAEEDYGEAVTQEPIDDAEEVSDDTDAAAIIDEADSGDTAGDNNEYAISEEADIAVTSEDEYSLIDDDMYSDEDDAETEIEPETEIEADAELLDAETENSDNLLMAEPDQCGDNLTWAYNEGVLTISGTGGMWNYPYDKDGNTAPWPDQVTKVVVGAGVTSIGECAFTNCKKIEEVSLPAGLTSIGDYAFDFCESIEEISFPDSLETLGRLAFCDCDNLKTVTFGSGLKDVDESFWRCLNVEKVYAPKGLTANVLGCFTGEKIKTAGPAGSDCNIEFGWDEKIPDNAFNGCKYLTSVTLPESITEIGSCAFYSCSALNDINLPSGITEIKGSAFYKCEALENIDIPESILKIGTSAFQYCSSLEEIILPDTISEVGYGAFFDCGKLSHIVIPASLTPGYSMFDNCPALKSAGPIGSGCNIEFGWTESIPEYAFYDCTSLESVTIPEGMTGIGKSSFAWCESLKRATVLDGLKNLGEFAFLGCTCLELITLPDSIESIGDSAFRGCSALRSFTVPKNVKSLPWNCFEDCSGLMTVIIPEGVTEIKDYAFLRCSSLDKIELPDTISSIKDSAFSGCSSLTEIEIPMGVSVIKYDTFKDCTRLKTVRLNYGVGHIYPNAFDGCTAIADVWYESLAENWNEITIDEGNDYLKNATKHFSEDKASGVWDNYVRWIIDKDGILRIEKIDQTQGHDVLERNAPWIWNSDQVTGVIISDGFIKIDSNAFTNYTKLKSLSFTSSITEISSNAFNNTALEKVEYTGTNEQWEELVKDVAGLKELSPKFKALVTFDPQGGKVTETSKIVEVGSKYGELPVPTRRGYTFVGWFLSDTATKPVTSGTKVTETEDHTLYARWKVLELKVSFDANGGTAKTKSKTVKFGELYGELPEAARKEYEFVGWYTHKDGGSQVMEEDLCDLDSNHTLYAHWSGLPHKLYFMNYDNETIAETRDVKYGDEYGYLPYPVPHIREGYEFDGWYTSLSYDQKVSEDTIVNGDQNIYQKWNGKTYTITFDPGIDGTVEPTTMDVIYGQKFGTLPIPVNGRKVFKCWVANSVVVVTEDTIVSDRSITAFKSETEPHELVASWDDVGDVRLDYTSLTMSVDEQKTLTATVYPIGQDPDIEWSSEDPSVASVGYDGVITAKAPGKTVITATLPNVVLQPYASCTVTVTASDARQDDDIADEFKAPDGLWTTGIAQSYDYTGAKITPQVKVYYGNALLRQNIDYSVTYRNNTNAGTALVIITGKGNISGKCTKQFKINPLTITDEDVDVIDGVYNNGKVVKPVVTVKHDGVKLKQSRDYTLSYEPVKEGSTTITVTGKGNYKGTIQPVFTVKAKNSPSLKNASVIGLKKSYKFEEIKNIEDVYSALEVKAGDVTLDSESDYELRSENCDRVGKGAIIVRPAEGSLYVGEKRVTINIVGTKLGSIKLPFETVTYNGTVHNLEPKNVEVYTGAKGKGDIVPTEAFSLSFSKNPLNTGTVTVTAIGNAKAGYSGKVSSRFKIAKRSIADENISVSLPEEINYTKGGVFPSPLVTYTDSEITWTLREGIDYTVSYTNNKAASGSKKASITITGKGNYSGKRGPVEFVIAKRNISGLLISCADIAANQSKKGTYYCSKPVIADVNGKALKEKTDYTVTYTRLDTNTRITAKDILPAGTDVRADIYAVGKNYSGSAHVIYSIKESPKDISRVKVGKIENCYYTGRPVEPDTLELKYPGVEEPLVKDTDYSITGYYNNVKKGTASLRIEGKGEYTGCKTITFRIVSLNAYKLWKGNYNDGKLEGFAPNTIYFMDTSFPLNYKGQLVPHFGPQGCDEPELIWKSSDTSIITVDKYGVITTKAYGTAQITVTSVDDKNLSFTAKITVE